MTLAARCLALSAVFVVFSGETTLENLTLGLVVGAVVTLATVRRRTDEARSPGGQLRRIAAAPWFAAGFVWQLVRGSASMLRTVWTHRRTTPTRAVKVPIGDRTDQGVALSALAASSAPGSILIDLTDDAMVFDEVGAGDARDDDRKRDAHERFYRRFQRRVRP